MKMREIGEDTAISTRLNKSEWEDIKNKGDSFFSNRNVGYMQVVPNNINFTETSPFFKELKELDSVDKEYTDKEKENILKVAKEIKKKET